MATSNEIAKTDDPQALAKQVSELSRRANSGDPRAMQELQPMIQRWPTVFEDMGDMARQVQSSLVNKMTSKGKALLTKDRIQAHLRKMQQDLSGSAPDPLERLLVERILTCWLEVQWYDHLYINSDNLALDLGDYCQRRQDRAHKRLLSAIKALAQVRRLALPVIQLNIAGQQVNTQQIIHGTAGQE